MLRHLDLFSGIGGFALAARMVGGYDTIAFCEIDPYAQAVLRKHWPGVPVYDDVRTVPRIACDVLTAGFPCQDISYAGAGAGIDGERSGLWHALPPLIGDLRPRAVLLENVAALLGRGIDRVLGDLAAVGYDAEWHCVPASHVGAPHIRDRVWIVAFPQHPDAHGERSHRAPGNLRATELRDEQGCDAGQVGAALADARSERREQHGECDSTAKPRIAPSRRHDSGRCGAYVADAALLGLDYGRRIESAEGSTSSWRSDYWLVEPDVGRVANGIPARVDRLTCLGNAIVPQVAAIFLQAIKEVIACPETT